jgi:hypothetical protein
MEEFPLVYYTNVISGEQSETPFYLDKRQSEIMRDAALAAGLTGDLRKSFYITPFAESGKTISLNINGKKRSVYTPQNDAQSNLHKPIEERAKGAFQFMDKTAKYIGLEDPSNFEEAAYASAKYMKKMYDIAVERGEENPVDAASVYYNRGHKWGYKTGTSKDKPLNEETTQYLKRKSLNENATEQLINQNVGEITEPTLEQPSVEQPQNTSIEIPNRLSKYENTWNNPISKHVAERAKNKSIGIMQDGGNLEYGSKKYRNAYEKGTITSYSPSLDLHTAKKLNEVVVKPENTSFNSLLYAEYARKNPIPKNTKWNNKGELVPANDNLYDIRSNTKGSINNWYKGRKDYTNDNKYRSLYKKTPDITLMLDKASLEKQMASEYNRELAMLNSEEGKRRIATSLVDIRPRFRNNKSLVTTEKSKTPQKALKLPKGASDYYKTTENILENMKGMNTFVMNEDDELYDGTIGYKSYHRNGLLDTSYGGGSIAQSPKYPLRGTLSHEVNHAILAANEKWQDRYLRDNIEFIDDETHPIPYMLENSDELTAYLRGARYNMVAHGLIKHPYEKITIDKLKEAYEYFNNDDNKKTIKENLSKEDIKSNLDLINEEWDLKKQSIIRSIERYSNSPYPEIINVANLYRQKLKDFEKERKAHLLKAEKDLAKPQFRKYKDQGNKFFKAIKPTEENFKHLERVLQDLATNEPTQTNTRLAKYGGQVNAKILQDGGQVSTQAMQAEQAAKTTNSAGAMSYLSMLPSAVNDVSALRDDDRTNNNESIGGLIGTAVDVTAMAFGIPTMGMGNKLGSTIGGAIKPKGVANVNKFYRKGGILQKGGYVDYAPSEGVAERIDSKKNKNNEIIQRSIDLANQRIKDKNFFYLPEESAEYKAEQRPRDKTCIGGVCNVLEESGMLPKGSNIYSNTVFQEKAYGLNFTNDGNNIDNLRPGSVLQYNHGTNSQGNKYPTHAQLFLGMTDDGKYRFFDNWDGTAASGGGNGERVYTKQELHDNIDTDGNGKAWAQIWNYGHDSSTKSNQRSKRLPQETLLDEMYDGDEYKEHVVNEKSKEYNYETSMPWYRNATSKGNEKAVVELFNNDSFDEKLKKNFLITQKTLDELKPIIYGIMEQESNFGRPNRPDRYLKYKGEKALNQSFSKGLGAVRYEYLRPVAKKMIDESSFNIVESNALYQPEQAYIGILDALLQSGSGSDNFIQNNEDLSDKHPWASALYFYNGQGKNLKRGYTSKGKKMSSDKGSYPYKVFKKAEKLKRTELEDGGNISTQGYKRNSPDINNEYNIIESNNITMKGVDFPVLGVDNLGNKKLMMPNNDYKFKGNVVKEIPLKKYKCLSCNKNKKYQNGGHARANVEIEKDEYVFDPAGVNSATFKMLDNTSVDQKSAVGFVAKGNTHEKGGIGILEGSAYIASNHLGVNGKKANKKNPTVAKVMLKTGGEALAQSSRSDKFSLSEKYSPNAYKYTINEMQKVAQKAEHNKKIEESIKTLNDTMKKFDPSSKHYMNGGMMHTNTTPSALNMTYDNSLLEMQDGGMMPQQGMPQEMPQDPAMQEQGMQEQGSILDQIPPEQQEQVMQMAQAAMQGDEAAMQQLVEMLGEEGVQMLMQELEAQGGQQGPPNPSAENSAAAMEQVPSVNQPMMKNGGYAYKYR